MLESFQVFNPDTDVFVFCACASAFNPMGGVWSSLNTSDHMLSGRWGCVLKDCFRVLLFLRLSFAYM